MARRISCILLSILLISSTLVSCGKKENNEETGKETVSITDNTETGEAAVAFQAYLDTEESI